MVFLTWGSKPIDCFCVLKIMVCTFTTYEIHEELIPGLSVWQNWILIWEVIKWDHCILWVAENDQNLEGSDSNTSMNEDIKFYFSTKSTVRPRYKIQDDCHSLLKEQTISYSYHICVTKPDQTKTGSKVISQVLKLKNLIVPGFELQLYDFHCKYKITVYRSCRSNFTE